MRRNGRRMGRYRELRGDRVVRFWSKGKGDRVRGEAMFVQCKKGGVEVGVFRAVSAQRQARS